MFRQQKVFPYERDGEILIVTPAGDTLSAQERQIKKEIETIHQILDQADCQHLIVQLNGAPYFGSIVIGAMMAVCGKVRNKNGKAAMCAATEGVLDSIEIMKLDAVVPYFKTRDDAVAYVRTDS